MNSGSPNPHDKTLGATDMVWRLLMVFAIATVVVVLIASVVWDTSTGLAALVASIICCGAAVAATYLSIYPQGRATGHRGRFRLGQRKQWLEHQ